ncbi:MAG TPA: hypothetical protein PKZ97_18260 [Azospirillaceae bacterium]|nr:hypothetical protein [Azospirillaceae bacterium]
MGVSSIGSFGFSSFTTPLNSGPTAGQPVQQADQAEQARAAEEAQNRQQTQRTNNQAQQQQSGGGVVTATRGQNLNISV